MRRTEIQHHSPEQVRGYFDDAREIIEGLDLDPAYREIAFAKAIDLLAAKNITVEQPAPLGVGGFALPGQRH